MGNSSNCTQATMYRNREPPSNDPRCTLMFSEDILESPGSYLGKERDIVWVLGIFLPDTQSPKAVSIKTVLILLPSLSCLRLRNKLENFSELSAFWEKR